VPGPHDAYRRLREEHGPVVWSEPHRGWLVLDHASVSAAFRDDRLSADRITPLERFVERHPGPARLVVDLLAGWMIFRDPPAHTRLREPVRGAFTARRLAAAEAAIRDAVEDLLDDVADAGTCDFKELVARPLPATVIAELLGVPPADRPAFQQWSDQLARVVFATTSRAAADPAAVDGAAAFTAYFRDLLARYRRHPEDNLLSDLAAAAPGAGISEQELIGACSLLLFAGHETTTGLLSNGLAALLYEHPHELERLRHDPGLDRTAVEELLRCEGPASVMVRRVGPAFEWFGHALQPGQPVFLAIVAANHDPAVFDDPARLDVGRDPNPHLAFGWGLHYCLGAPLARVETRIALRRLFERFPRLRPGGPAPVRSDSFIGYGVNAVPIAV
jgi:cytochrome P450